MRWPIAVATLLLAGAAYSAQRADYGYAWEIGLEPGRAAHRLTLTEEVYRRIGDSGLEDFEAFNAAGEPVPFGPVPPASGVPNPPLPTRIGLPWFALPNNPDASDRGLSVQFERDADGRLRRLVAIIEDTSVDASPNVDFLVDASAVIESVGAHSQRPTIESIELVWQAVAGGNLSARFEVLGSDDFEHWHSLIPQASLLDLDQGSFRLTRRAIQLPAHSARYLLLRRLDVGAELKLETVTARFWTASSHEATAPLREWSDARHRITTEKPQSFEYRLIGPLPVERVTLRLASANSVANLTLQSRDSEHEPWQTRSQLTAFRVEAAGSVLEHDDLSVDVARDRLWRIVASPPLDRPPTLRVGYRPDQFAMLAQGEPPYSVAAGSAIGRRENYPMAELLGTLSSEVGREWQLSPARFGATTTLKGAAALASRPPRTPVGVWALWAVLAAGVIAVVWMVLRLLRTPPPQS